MSTLRSAIDEIRGEDLDRLTDRQLQDDFAELQVVVRMLEAERLRRLAAIDRRGAFKDEGYLTASAWLIHRFREAPSVAGREVRMAAALEEMPKTREALADGELAESAVSLLMSARETSTSRFAEAEPMLVDAARTLDPRDLSRAVAYWRQAADEDETLRDAERSWDRRHLHVSRTMFGMVRVDGDLDPETGQTLITALRAVQDSEARSGESKGTRTPGQRRVDALHEICRQWLDRADRPAVAGERPHVNVLVDVAALNGRVGRTSELEDAGPVHPDVIRRLACDASISRVIVQGRSEPLDVGRRTPVISPAIRRALMIRDRHCRFPGCGRPGSWCDGHHVVHWADGGSTSLANLVLLCRPHHRPVHRAGGPRLELREGKPRFTRSDGTVMEGRGPPWAG